MNVAGTAENETVRKVDAMVQPSSAKPYRYVFAAAAVYNVAFGLWAGLFPQAFFSWMELPPPTYPSVWACLGMVVGLYGPLYAYVAWKPERGDLIAAVGLAGKVLGPLGWLLTVAGDELPPRTFLLVLFNDLIWWFPFLFYLLRRSPWRATIIAGIVVAVHLAACVALLISSPGTETNPDLASRAAWVAGHPAAWTTTWFLWAVSSMSLLAFCVVWANVVGSLRAPSARRVGTARTAHQDHADLVGGAHPTRQDTILPHLACLIVALGLLCDLAGEIIQITRATSAGLTVKDFIVVTRWYTLLGPGAANGLYCVGGLMLSTIAWRTGSLRGPLGALGIMMWSVGLLLTVAALFDHRFGMILTGGGVMLLFTSWAAALAWQWRQK